MSDSPESDIPATCDAAKHQQLVINVAFHATIFRLQSKTADFVGNQPFSVERMTGVEPAFKAWEAFVLPMNYIRKVVPFGHETSV